MHYETLNTAFHHLLLGLLAALAFSFTRESGGDLYEIRLNNTLLLRQFVHLPLNSKTLNLGTAKATDQLHISYSHCGAIGKARQITAKDENNKVLQQWRFKEASGSNSSMTIPVKELLELEKKNAGKDFQLFYSSKELPAGRRLASLRLGNTTVASSRDKATWPLLNAGAVWRIASR